jgi:hypothetical protein
VGAQELLLLLLPLLLLWLNGVASSFCCTANRLLTSYHQMWAAFRCFLVGYKEGKIYWPAIHSNQANLKVRGLRRSGVALLSLCISSLCAVHRRSCCAK